ncbi:hypothetical protein LOTGIDRAFT_162036 [Lottia gigantea]|uniref:Uncharacterized protein n=1 Tax=Lottia gigantea TaxID=225164 RepID=V4AHY6_LOTGI|nr:hypothetical protein LOTGIDRAFT_162036 [Lottia gigantea]ESO93011.1 hypothetical protein LOTGIDRAFT_162036 [Lottia gigantea]
MDYYDIAYVVRDTLCNPSASPTEVLSVDDSESCQNEDPLEPELQDSDSDEAVEKASPEPRVSRRRQMPSRFQEYLHSDEFGSLSVDHRKLVADALNLKYGF